MAARYFAAAVAMLANVNTTTETAAQDKQSDQEQTHQHRDVFVLR